MRRLAALLLLVTLSACATPAPTTAPAPTQVPTQSVTSSPSPPPPTTPSPSPAPTASPVPSASVACVPDPNEFAPGGSGDPCPPALAAVRAAVAPLGLSVTRVYIQPGVFWCGVVWPGFQSMPLCAGVLVVPGASMHGWVAFAGTAKVAAVGLARTPPHGAAPGGPWRASVVAFMVPPGGWAMP